jgi:hypothetical protein
MKHVHVTANVIEKNLVRERMAVRLPAFKLGAFILVLKVKKSVFPNATEKLPATTSCQLG